MEEELGCSNEKEMGWLGDPADMGVWYVYYWP